ncbi:hypothetical protein APR41_00440 [Salegentibacter salinarum]|uniref:Secreted protein n=1 Tax=Salegentibacter salinarum TaxID=447422 RepID=A0A2N0U3B1_9FLAO|nr:hypothetical protein [Salegentibacter salinarum]PKD21489.1 hypothetical protein APR41_00440 [Salegentibacter salinarum]SKB37775.1 hypothetical protein SAMN05660903_00480 [Salegentibacter salinarum]
MKINFNKVMLGLAVVSLAAFTSCKDAEEKTTEETQTVPNTEMSGNTSGNAETPDINPPHGEPGHRCDMPVGASLSGASSNNNTNAGSDSEMTSSPIRLKESKPTKNPAHGEPYHDCSIPVGADLEG